MPLWGDISPAGQTEAGGRCKGTSRPVSQRSDQSARPRTGSAASPGPSGGCLVTPGSRERGSGGVVVRRYYSLQSGKNKTEVPAQKTPMVDRV